MTPRSRWTLAAGILLALAAGTLSLAVVSAQEEEDAPAPAAAGEDHAALVKALGDPDFAARERAYGALEKAGASARKALEKGAKSQDSQVRWASRRLLRLLDEKEAPRRRVLDFEDLWEAREQALPPLPSEGGFDRALEELRARMKELEAELGRRRSPAPLPSPLRFDLDLGHGGGARVERHAVLDRDGERTEVRVEADGKVKVTLSRRGEDGESAKEESFEAESLEALERDHPEVHAKVKDLLGNLEVRSWGDYGRDLLGVRPPRVLLRLGDDAAGSVRKALLGVTVSPVPEVLRAHLPAVPEGVGLVVEEVLSRSLAEAMGLRRHDIVLSVNGIPVSSADEVRSAMEAVKKGGEVRLRILRGGKAEGVSGTR